MRSESAAVKKGSFAKLRHSTCSTSTTESEREKEKERRGEKMVADRVWCG